MPFLDFRENDKVSPGVRIDHLPILFPRDIPFVDLADEPQHVALLQVDGLDGRLDDLALEQS